MLQRALQSCTPVCFHAVAVCPQHSSSNTHRNLLLYKHNTYTHNNDNDFIACQVFRDAFRAGHGVHPDEVKNKRSRSDDRDDVHALPNSHHSEEAHEVDADWPDDEANKHVQCLLKKRKAKNMDDNTQPGHVYCVDWTVYLIGKYAWDKRCEATKLKRAEDARKAAEEMTSVLLHPDNHDADAGECMQTLAAQASVIEFGECIHCAFTVMIQNDVVFV
jgi:hypothetical protein